MARKARSELVAQCAALRQRSHLTKPIKKCLAVRHVAFEDLGLLGPLVSPSAATASATTMPASSRFDAETLLAPDLLIVLGGPIGVYEIRDLSVHRRRNRRDRSAARRRQADARHLPRRADDGGGARRARRAGAGQGDRLGAVELDGRRPRNRCWRRSARRRCCIGTATIANCRRAANGSPSTQHCPVQAFFRLRPSQLALQFHLETEPARLRDLARRPHRRARQGRHRSARPAHAGARTRGRRRANPGARCWRRGSTMFADLVHRRSRRSCRTARPPARQPAAGRADLVPRRRPGAGAVHAGGRGRSRAISSRNLPAEIPVTVIGLGSNLIVRDGGVPGVVVRLGRGFNEVAVDGVARARRRRACPTCKVARAAQEAGIAGLAFLRGIPGAIGGALRMNGGAYGGETKDVLVEARGVDRARPRPRASATPTWASATATAARPTTSSSRRRCSQGRARRPGGHRGRDGQDHRGARGDAADQEPHRRLDLQEPARRTRPGS